MVGSCPNPLKIKRLATAEAGFSRAGKSEISHHFRPQPEKSGGMSETEARRQGWCGVAWETFGRVEKSVIS
jgi:hypothetical protein